MGNIREKDRWPENIYRKQTTDFVTGGPDGIANIQPQQLADRTLFLRNLLEKEHTVLKREDIPQSVIDTLGEFYLCRHHIDNSMVADDAAIAYTKLNLDIPLEELRSLLDSNTANINDLLARVHSLVGVDGYLVSNLARLIRLTWLYSDFGFDFEFFTEGLTMRDMLNINSRGAVAHDDSLDCETTDGLSPGMRLLLSDASHSEEVEIWKILENGRIRLTKDITHTYDPETTQIGYTDWSVFEGYAIARIGGVYYSHVSSVLENAPFGKLLICRQPSASQMLVEYRSGEGDGAWVTAPRTVLEDDTEGRVLEHYSIGGGYVQLRVTVGGNDPAHIHYMALFPLPVGQLVSTIKTPRVLAPQEGKSYYRTDMQVNDTVFRSAYRDKYVRTEYALFDPDTGDRVSSIISAENNVPLDVSEDVLPVEGRYVIQCRHMSDIGEWSPWSQSVLFRMKELRYLFGFENTENSRGFGQAPYNSLADDEIRFGFAGAPKSGGFDEALFTMATE